MQPANPTILTINGGSSSIRVAIFEGPGALRKKLSGKIDRIGLPHATFEVSDQSGKRASPLKITSGNHRTAVDFLLDWLDSEPAFTAVCGVGHRVVHGMKHSEPVRVTPKLLTELHQIAPFAPEHLPREIGLIEAVRKRHPNLPQIACFDTAFHRTMPQVAKLLPISRRYTAKGVERYGFHGLSYCFLMQELSRLDPAAAKGRVILAHLGNGASLAAVHSGKSVDTSMGLTPASGLVMSTRSGDVDPGLIGYLARAEGVTVAQFEHMVNHESGLLGVSGTSSDMRDLLKKEAVDMRAAEAIALFCYQAKKWIGSFAAALGGVDTLVFAGGIGENSAAIRARICQGLNFLGISLDKRRNSRNAPLISTDSSRVAVRVIATDEELMLAKLSWSALGLDYRGKEDLQPSKRRK